MSNDDWNTPPEIRDLCLEVLDHLDMDPCSNRTSQLWATNEFTIEDDGLSIRWHEFGRTALVNPPYSRAADFLAKCEVESSEMDIIALVNNCAATNCWHEHVWPHAAAICFPKGRIAFLKDGEPVKGNRYEQALILYSDSIETLRRFREVFSRLGAVVTLDHKEAS